MPDPVSTIATALGGGVAAGLGKKLADRAWESGERWIASYFRDHQHKAIAVAEENAKAMLNRLAIKVAKLEEESEIEKDLFVRALEEPSFGVLLQKALIGSAQTSSGAKHEVLAQLLTERLKAAPDSMLKVASQMGCDAITHSTESQIKILALVATARLITPQWEFAFENREHYLANAKHWFQARFAPYV